MSAGDTGSGGRHLAALGVVAALLAGPATAARAQEIGALVSPGPLAKAHAKLEGIANCQKCHEPGRKVTAAKCLECHKPIVASIAAKKGVHRGVTTDCVGCHVEHAGADAELRPLDTKKFDHVKETGYALDGKHAVLVTDCAKCHKTRSYLGLKADCASCHQDPHRGALGPNCAGCHSTAVAFNESEKAFDHGKTAFPLDQAHVKVECAKCHVDKVYKGLKFALCTDCHKDPHLQAFGSACASCHAGATWKTEKVDHSRTRFALAGKHQAVACASCHRQPAMRARLEFDRCAVCHADPHTGEFKQDCAACHTVETWKSAPFDHGAKTGFPLTGRHAAIPCADCHKKASTTPGRSSAQLDPARRGLLLASFPTGGPQAEPPAPREGRTPASADFRGLSKACASCHADVHAGKLGTACESCHGSETFRVTTFKHPKNAELYGGEHAKVPCGKCHGGEGVQKAGLTGKPVGQRVYRGMSEACASCHKDVHFGQLGANCESCHTVEAAKFAAPKFSHATTAFALTGKHTTTECAKCHARETAAFPAGTGTAVHFKGVATACASCHKDVHLGQLGDRCQSCHGAETFKLATYKHRENPEFFTAKHATTRCQDCHKNVEADFPGGHGTAVRYATLTSACASCHEDVHRGTLGSRCETCHGTQQWPGASRAFHKATVFPLDGQHLRVACAECHFNGQTKGTPNRCYDCHWIRHQDDVYRTQLGTDCENCHRTTSWRSVVWTHEAATGFALAGAHAALDCQSCHRDLQFHGASADCYSCHQRDFASAKDPPHVAGGFSTECKFCHRFSDTSWQQARFDHSQTPFPLLGVHAAQPCAACHVNNVFKGTPTACVGCHQTDFNNSKNPNHAAAGFSTACDGCHKVSDATWSVAVFNHAATAFPLLGVHATQACSACHGDNVFKGKSVACVSCHQKDFNATTNPPHAAAGFSTTCDGCHKVSDASWTQATFNHSVFPLSGVHATTACANCHVNGNYGAALPTNCAGCHTKDYQAATAPVNHAGLPTACDSCHNFADASWTLASSFNHATYFALAGAHSTATCSSCHVNGNYATLPTSPCYACHATDYTNAVTPVNHVASNFPTTCDTCHKFSDTSWTQATFSHTTFPLSGAHATTACANCHVNNNYTTVPTNCAGCHTKDYQTATTPVNHAGLPTACDSCHNFADASWTLASSFNHATYFTLAGAHTAAACTSCHVNGNFTTVPTSPCYACHATDFKNATTPVNHVASNFPTTCDTCHKFTDTSWTQGTFNHAGVFPLVGVHATTACANCHVNNNYTTVPTTCVGCHLAVYQGATTPVNHAGLPTACDSCHNAADAAWTLASTFNHATYFALAGAHATTGCANCHVNGNYTTVPTTPCYACHATDYQNATTPVPHANFPTTCDTCHKFSDTSWTQATFNHATVYPLVGVHTTTACANCHVNGNYTTVPTTCVGCHLAVYQGATTPVNHAGLPTTCDSCHNAADASWTLASTFNHATYFPLAGVHTTTACANCHVNGNYTTVPTTCVGCHLSDYQGATTPVNHVGLPTTCNSCHNFADASWTLASTFNHANYFPLAGAHSTTACANCHVNGNYTTVPTGPCYACHATDYQNAISPVNHIAAGFPTTCDTCHKFSDTSWLQGTFNHTWFPINHGNSGGICTVCHTNPSNYAVFSCTTGCHPQSEANQQHQGVPGYVYSSPACYSCHPNGTTGNQVRRRTVR